MPSLSVVIPCLNEAGHLAELLPQFAGQTLRPREVIVADADSPDGSARAARALGALVTPGGRPAQGRNSGAAAATGDWLLFMDADARLPHGDTLRLAVTQMESRGLAAAVTDLRPYYRPEDRGFTRPWLRAGDRVLMRTHDLGQRLFLRLGFPVGTAVFLITRREVFSALGGFRAGVEPFEDSEYLLRAHKAGRQSGSAYSRSGVLAPPVHCLYSTRRFDAWGRLVFPARLSLRGTLLRFLLRRELPLPSYWDLNRRGYGKRD